jgi:hypothetical protein
MVGVNVAIGIEKWTPAATVARALLLDAACLTAARFRSARLIMPIAYSAAEGAHRARVLAPAIRWLRRALGHRLGGLDEPDIRAAGDTEDAAAAKASARDLQDGLAVDIDRAAALVPGNVGHQLMSSTEISIAACQVLESGSARRIDPVSASSLIFALRISPIRV